MSASDNLGQQFVTLYRGLRDVHPDKVNTEKMGIHWTRSKQSAEYFSLGVLPSASHSPLPKNTTVLRAKVPKEHIVSRRSEEFKKLADEREILPHEEDGEKEVTIRPGSPIDAHVIQHATYTGEKGAAYKVQKIKKSLKGKA